MVVQEVRWDRGGTELVAGYTFFSMEMGIILTSRAGGRIRENKKLEPERA
jgi:hypothetical protein